LTRCRRFTLLLPLHRLSPVVARRARELTTLAVAATEWGG
jgi:hypothetical protein